MSFILGIDTGGTNTDSVILDADTHEVIASAKAFTTPSDLQVGIQNSIEQLDFHAYESICRVSLSTTLATNSIVERRGCRVGLILCGNIDTDTIPAHMIISLSARLDIRGKEQISLNPVEVQNAIDELTGNVDAIAISGFASVRNPSHEKRIREMIENVTSLPVFCAHELTSSLGFLERTLTTVLNASLIRIIHDFLDAAKAVLAAFGIHAPVTVMRSDGSLMTEAIARHRPIDTILSGPAASILGAKHLTGQRDAIILDMGGTTTDIADLSDNKVCMNPEGARVGGYMTRCRAAMVSTHGIGGDSRIQFTDNNSIMVGPVKAVPISAAVHKYPWLREEYLLLRPGDDISCYELKGNPNAFPAFAETLKKLEDGPHTVQWLSRHDTGAADLPWERLISVDIVRPVSLTPTDILHMIGRFKPWNVEVPRHIIDILPAQTGMSKEKLLREIIHAVSRKLTFACIQSTADFDGNYFSLMEDDAASYLVDKMFASGSSEFLHADFHLKKPVIAVGGPVAAWMPRVSENLHTELIIPQNADVANAIGAAIATFHETADALVRPAPGQSGYSVYLPDQNQYYDQYDAAVSQTKKYLERYIKDQMRMQGAVCDTVLISEREIYNEVFSSGRRFWIETRLTAESDNDSIIS